MVWLLIIQGAITKQRFSPAKVMTFLGKTNKKTFSVFEIPKIKETYHAAKQFAVPGLFQLKVDIAGAAAKHVQVVEKVVRAPFVHLRLDVALTDRHFRIGHLAHLFQIVTHGLLALDEAGIDDMSAVFGC